MKHRKWRGVWGKAPFIAPVLLIFSLYSIPTAQAAPGPATTTIAPAFQEVDVSAGQPQQSCVFKLTNNSNYPQQYQLLTVDFGTLDETGGVAFLGAKPSDFEQKYGLASWLVLEKDQVYADPGQSQTVTVTIDNRESLAPGGHYGAILVKASPQNPSRGKDLVQLNEELSALVLAKKEGGIVYNLKLDSAQSNGAWWRLPSHAELRFQNSGNVHAVPRGLVRLIDPRGREVARGLINADSSFVLPESFRRLSAPLSSLSRAFWPGRYRLVVQYRYDGSAKVTTWQENLTYLPVATWLAALAVLGLLMAGMLLIYRALTRRRNS